MRSGRIWWRRAAGYGLLLAAGAVLACRAACATPSAHATELPPEEAQAWLRHVSPLPKQVEVRGKVVLRPDQIEISTPDAKDVLVEQAVRELRESLRLAGRYASGRRGAFRLALQLRGPEAKRLRRLRNGDQAYRIFPEPGGHGLRLVGLTPRGLYYAGKTLSQLVSARATGHTVEIPMAEVVDWPDMAERGLWGADSFAELAWLGDVKMNIVEQIAAIWVDEQGRGHGKMKPGREPMTEVGPRYGIQPVPAVVHLNQLAGKGLFEAYPELRADGGDEGAICYSQPAMVRVLADWIVELGSLPGVPEVSVWLTENLHGRGGCRCAKCQEFDRNVLETRVVLEGWRLARERLPEVGLRLLLSEETYRSNDLILREIPEGVKVTYYHSLLTYTAGRQQMIYPLMAEYAGRGRWLGVTPQLSGSVGRATPFSGAQFMHYRMNEFVSKGLSGVTGYASPRLKHARFNVEAAAEWSWNARGRTSREFARCYAVRHGVGAPERFAEWSETIGPVAWDVYGSEWPAGELRRALTPVVSALRKGSLPDLGEVQLGVYRAPWAEFKSPQQLTDDLAAASRAVALARELGQPELVQESLVIEGYVMTLKALWELRQVVGPEGIAQSDRHGAGSHFAAFIDGCEQAAEALGEWSRIIAPEVAREAGGRYWQIAEVLERDARDMRALARELGVNLAR